MEAEIISKENIKPSSPTPSHLKTFDLSALDQLPVAPYVPLILYYPMNGDNTFQALEMSTALKKSLSQTLTQFYPLAGTLKNDFSIDCNDVGANYVVALIHRRLDEFLKQPDHRIINSFFPVQLSLNESCSVGDPVTNIQVTIFDCGGMAIALCVSHKIVDGSALQTFLKAWSNMARGSEEAEVVYPNLTTPSLFPAKGSWLKDASMLHAHSLLKEGKCCTKRFVFGPDAIARMRDMASRNGVQQPTRVEVVSGLIWKCGIGATKEACGVQKPSSLSHVVNLRPKLKPTSSNRNNNFIGNMLWHTKPAFLASDDLITPLALHTLVNKVRGSISKVNVEFVEKAQGAEGYVEMQKCMKEMMGEVAVGSMENYFFTSWCKMGFYDIDFGWGNPSWVAGPILDGLPVFMNFVILMDTKCGEGIEAWVTLDESQMEILHKNQELLSYATIDPSPML